jgi:hypothetical protein
MLLEVPEAALSHMKRTVPDLWTCFNCVLLCLVVILCYWFAESSRTYKTSTVLKLLNYSIITVVIVLIECRMLVRYSQKFPIVFYSLESKSQATAQ